MSNRLPVLAAAARDAHRDIGLHLACAAERALEAGAALQEAKALVKHGAWASWLAGTGISARTASRYMVLARSGMSSAIVADFGLNRAERYATTGERMIPAPGCAKRAYGSDLTGGFGSVAYWWSSDELLEYRLVYLMPDKEEIIWPRAPIMPWVAALVHEGEPTRFGLYEEVEILVAEALDFSAKILRNGWGPA